MGMEPFVAMDDNAFGHLIASIPNPVDAIRQAIAFKTGIAQKQAETAQTQAQAQDLAAQADDRTQQLQRQQQFQQDLATVGSNPNPQAISSLVMKYPEFADHIKQGWDVKDAAQKQADLTSTGEVYSAAASGNWDLAAKQVQARIDAEKTAGTADDSDTAMLDQIQRAGQGDAGAQKQVLTMLGTHLAAVTGPDHFASVYGALKGGYTLEAGATRYDDSGNVVAQSPFIKGADGTIFERDGHGGTTAAPGTGKAAPATPGGDGGFNTAVAFTLKHEGGYNPHDMNGAPVNFGINQGANPGVDVKSLTPEQATEIYKTKYWDKSGAADLPAAMQTPYFDTYIINPKRAQQFLKASGGDPAKFMQLRENWMGQVAAKNPQYAKAYATRNADLRLTMQGDQGSDVATPSGATAPAGYHVLVPGTTPDQYRTLTPAEVKQRGLDSTQQYQLNTKTGALTGLGRTGAAAPPGNPDLTGPEYLADLKKNNPSLAAQAQGVLDTRLAYPPATARSPQAQQLRAAVLQIDPSYDEQAYARRKTTIQQYTPGHAGPGQSMLSAATIINHMYDLAQAARNLPDHSTATQNAISSWYAKETNQPWLIKFNEGRKFVASELPKFLNGKAPTEGEQRDHYESYSPSKGKSGIQTALSTDVDYLYGRYQPLIQAYKDNTGKDLKIDDYAPGQLTQAKAAALEYYRANGALPVVVSSAAQAAKLPHGSVFTTPDGRVLRRN